MVDAARWTAWIVIRDRNTVVRDDLETLVWQFNVDVTVGTRIHDAPELPFAWQHRDFRAQYAVNGEQPVHLVVTFAAGRPLDLHT